MTSSPSIAPVQKAERPVLHHFCDSTSVVWRFEKSIATVQEGSDRESPVLQMS
jgi:hypothetical protein